LKKNDILTPKDIKENIITTDFDEEMKSSYIDYAISVLGDRALADVRDGLKPVQRRVLYGMDELKLSPMTPYKKSARIVGDVMGKYHPHGDSSIYGALVTMAKAWLFPYPLVDGHGNFGSIEGDGAAAMRYTEARLAEISKKFFFDDIDKDTVDFRPNFDETETEPVVLPARIPNLLISGSEGIACGMAASIPSHNAGEVLDAVLAYIKNRKISIEGLMEYIKGPDFATGGVIANKSDLKNIYETGSGRIRVRGKVEIEEGKGGKKRIVITEIPQTMVGSIDKFMDSVAELYRSKKMPDIADISNMSSKAGTKIVIELKKGADAQKNINILYKKTKLEDTFGVNMLAVKNFQPHVYNLKEFIGEFIDFQFEINRRKYRFLLKKENKVKEIKEGLIKACDCIDLIIEIIRGSRTKTIARECLVRGRVDDVSFKTAKAKKEASKLLFTERQADAIMSMQLQSLIGLEIEQLRKEFHACCKRILEYEGYLTDSKSMEVRITADLKAIRKELKQERKTEIIDAGNVILEKEEIEEEDFVALVDRFGYVKLVDMATYSRNIESIPNDYRYAVITKNTDKLFLFTDRGMKHQIKCLDIPTGKYKDKGIPLEVISGYSLTENIVCISTEMEAANGKYLFVTENGLCKIVSGSEFIVSRKSIDATKFKEEGDKVISVVPVADNSRPHEHVGIPTDVIMASNNGNVLKFSLKEVSELKKNSAGIVGMKLKKGESVTRVFLTADEDKVTVLDKTVNAKDIKRRKRGGIGAPV